MVFLLIDVAVVVVFVVLVSVFLFQLFAATEVALLCYYHNEYMTFGKSSTNKFTIPVLNYGAPSKETFISLLIKHQKDHVVP